MQLAKSASLGWQGTFSGNFPHGRQKTRGIGYQFFGCTWFAGKGKERKTLVRRRVQVGPCVCACMYVYKLAKRKKTETLVGSVGGLQRETHLYGLKSRGISIGLSFLVSISAISGVNIGNISYVGNINSAITDIIGLKSYRFLKIRYDIVDI